jgi:hypothetical protein
MRAAVFPSLRHVDRLKVDVEAAGQECHARLMDGGHGVAEQFFG